MRRGVAVQDYWTKPAQVKLIFPEANLPAREPPIRYRQSTYKLARDDFN
jgi:hypothetical protein